MPQTEYIKPPVNKALFYTANYQSFHYAVFKQMDKSFGDGYTGKEDYKKSPYLSRLHPILKTLYFFDQVLGFTHEGGFGELYSYENGFMLEHCVRGFYELGEQEMVAMMCFAADYYELLESQAAFQNLSKAEQIAYVKNLSEHRVDFDLPVEKVSYDDLNIESFENLNNLFENKYKYAWYRLVRHIQNHAGQFVSDETGQPLDDGFTGQYVYTGDVGNHYRLTMENGKPHGIFEIDDTKQQNWVGEFEHGFLKKQSYRYHSPYSDSVYTAQYQYEPYDNGKDVVVTYIKSYDHSSQFEKQTCELLIASDVQIGKQTEWYEDGSLKSVKDYYSRYNPWLWRSEAYYPNGQLKHKGLKHRFNTAYWEYYHENGQQLREEFYDNEGNCHQTKWYPDGSIALQTVYGSGGEYLETHEFYPDGTKRMEYLYKMRKEMDISPYLGWVKMPINAWDEHGKQTLINGTGFIPGGNTIEEYQNGFATVLTEFYHDGNLSRKVFYERGKEIKVIVFDENGNEKWARETEFDDDGNMLKKVSYEYGKKVRTICYDKDGNFIDEEYH
ncbi:toxin-antitoxin system YwqK family antitoxin [Conchiformibius kuhniae]|uniref:Toxin-antitoxin system YwqK family antitoxin n=1 Tax=Conchiformibius kuhniae TaxID=211502 RepID=A0A8T9MVG1_9NEIS|nr:hypothetical protein [Conchiformibius kuhniae]UOP04378.1 hypothetical protein LVJ77_08555 [Conchiformibius kuhniae]